MGFIVLFVCILMLIKSVKDNVGKIITPQTLFYMLWTFVIFLSILNLYNIIKPSNMAYFLILLMLVFFFIGSNFPERKKFFLASKNKNKNNNKNINKLLKITNKIKVAYKPEYKYFIIYTLCALIIIFTLIDCAIVFKGLKDGIPMYKIRHWRMGAYGIDNNPMLARRSFIEEIFRNVILNPFETLMPPIAAYTFFNKKETRKNKIAIITLSLVILILSSVAGGGGRLSYIYFFGCFLLAFLQYINNNKNCDLKKYIKYIVIILIFGLLATILLTKIRTQNSIFKQIYTYFAMPPTLLTLWLTKLKDIEHKFKQKDKSILEHKRQVIAKYKEQRNRLIKQYIAEKKQLENEYLKNENYQSSLDKYLSEINLYIENN